MKEKTEKSIEKIFGGGGEEKFRKLESKILKEVLRKSKNTVIDCGGGVVLNEENIKILKEKAEIICLTASPDIILERISKEEIERHLLNVQNKREGIRDLLAEREQF